MMELKFTIKKQIGGNGHANFFDIYKITEALIPFSVSKVELDMAARTLIQIVAYSLIRKLMLIDPYD